MVFFQHVNQAPILILNMRLVLGLIIDRTLNPKPLHSRIIIGINTIRNHIETKVTLPRYNGSHMLHITV